MSEEEDRILNGEEERKKERTPGLTLHLGVLFVFIPS
jgi:hypothetical protein